VALSPNERNLLVRERGIIHLYEKVLTPYQGCERHREAQALVHLLEEQDDDNDASFRLS
jgi:hypothetical protein